MAVAVGDAEPLADDGSDDDDGVGSTLTGLHPPRASGSATTAAASLAANRLRGEVATLGAAPFRMPNACAGIIGSASTATPLSVSRLLPA